MKVCSAPSPLEWGVWCAFSLVVSILSDIPNLKRMRAESLSSSLTTPYHIPSGNFQGRVANLIHWTESNDSRSLIHKSFSCCFFGSRPFSEIRCHQEISCLMRQVGSLFSERQALIFSVFHQRFPQPSSPSLPGWCLWLHQVMRLSLLITQYGFLIDPTYPVLSLFPSWLLCYGEMSKIRCIYCVALKEKSCQNSSTLYPFLNYFTDSSKWLFLRRLQSWFKQGRQETLLSSRQQPSNYIWSLSIKFVLSKCKRNTQTLFISFF